MLSLYTELLGNSLIGWASFILAILFYYFGLKLSLKFLTKKLSLVASRTATHWDDALVELLSRTRSCFLFAVSLYFASQLLTLPNKVSLFSHKAIILIFLYQTLMWSFFLINEWCDLFLKNRISGEQERSAITQIVGLILKIALLCLLVLVALDNLGFNVTTLIAGLGVGGVAIALAVQRILGDLFSSITILLDKPFTIGDSIVVGEFSGTIEQIGLKTTRIRSATGEQLIFSNTDILQSRIRNFKRMQERRVLFTIGLAYKTTFEQLQSVPSLIQNIVQSQNRTRFSRAHFFKYGENALIFEVEYWVTDSDYRLYMDVQQEINLEIFKQLQVRDIKLARPNK